MKNKNDNLIQKINAFTISINTNINPYQSTNHISKKQQKIILFKNGFFENITFFIFLLRFSIFRKFFEFFKNWEMFNFINTSLKKEELE